MTLQFTDGVKTVTNTETDIFTPITTQQYYGINLFIQNIGTNDLIVRQYTWNPRNSTYQLAEPPHTQIGLPNDTCLFVPIKPCRRFKITVQRTEGVGANTDYVIDYDIITQSG
jgi:hypothetical protein